MPVRWNYVHWLQQLLDTTSETYKEDYDDEREVLGVDIGTGASAIYPLLACKTRPQWRVFAMEIDETSAEWARKNVELNELSQNIRVTPVKGDSPPMIPEVIQKRSEPADFCMTNPPFYKSLEDMQNSKLNKTASPHATCTGWEREMIYPGGDEGFVNRIIDESLKLREKVRWYTAMLGKLESLENIVKRLRREGITNFAVTCLQAGNKTKRWAVGWSFGDYLPRNDVARHGELVKSVLPQVTEHTVSALSFTREEATSKVDEIMKAIQGEKLSWRWNATTKTGIMECQANMWSRNARRQQARNKDVEMGDGDEDEEDDVEMTNGTDDDEDRMKDVVLAAKLIVHSSVGKRHPPWNNFEPPPDVYDEKETGSEVEVRWLRGRDWNLFQSFCGMLKAQLKTKG